MLEKPPIPDDHIIACLRENYHLAITTIEFLPLGYDNYAAVYRLLSADDHAYFLKIKNNAVSPSSLALPHFLKTHGLTQVVAPLPTISQTLFCSLDNFTLLLYPYIDGQGAWGRRLPDHLLLEYGAFLRQLHATQLPAELRSQLPGETFIPNTHWSSILSPLHEGMPHIHYAHPIAQQTAAFWREKHAEISLIIQRANAFGRQLQEQPPEFVLCHADIHQGNLLITPDETLYVVDWDQPILAPKECDLLFVMLGGFVSEPHVEALILQGYGPTEINWLALAYYRYARALEDLAGFAEPIFLMDDLSDDVKQEQADKFRVQFEPGGIIEAAHQLAATLPISE